MVEPTSRIEVNLSAVEHNLAVIRRALAAGSPGRTVGVCGVVKADAYGLGAVRIAKRLEACGVDMLAVYSPEEASRLVEAAIRLPILMLMPVRGLDRTDPLYRAAGTGRLHFTVHDLSQVEALATTTDTLGVTLALHVDVDTGMSRGGAAPTEARELVRAIDAHPRLRLAGVSTHFADPAKDDAFTRAQSDRFDGWLASVEKLIPERCVIHHANSAGTFRAGAHHRDMVRVGLALLGYGVEGEGYELAEHAADLRPAMRWTTRIVHVREIPAATTVGYGRAWEAPRPSRIALAPVGYAEGYPPAMSNRGVVMIGDGERYAAPVVGRVSMDQITFDVTDVPEEAARLGAEVEIFSDDASAPNSLTAGAAACGMTPHQLLAGLGARTPRVYRIERAEPAAPAHAMRA